jgi:hypothetical protein
LKKDRLYDRGRLTLTKNIKLRPNQPPKFYVGIDITNALDTIAWGHLWNATFGWRNLLLELDKDPTDKQRRVDKAHPKLPIARLVRTHDGNTFADTCIFPQGEDGKGIDKLWSGPHRFDNRADMSQQSQFMQSFILSPGVVKASSSLDDTLRGVAAEIVYISSHGLSTGAMPGEDPDIDYIFDLAKAVSSGNQFAGPKWLLLSNCSTLISSTRKDWQKLMTGPIPLRGIVGFRNTCPLASGSVNVFSSFISALSLGKTFIKAWEKALKANGLENSWVAICHENAVGDTIADLNNNSLKSIPSTSKVLVFEKSNPAGVEVVPQPDPFSVSWSKGGVTIAAANQSDPKNKLGIGDVVSITVNPIPPATTFGAGTKFSVTLIYIRPNYPVNVDINKIFDIVTQSGSSAPITSDLNKESPGGDDSWELTTLNSPKQVVLTLKCKSLTGMHSNYHLWLRVELPTIKYDFIRNGSILLK